LSLQTFWWLKIGLGGTVRRRMQLGQVFYLAEQDFFERALRLENLPILSKDAICPSDEIIQLGMNNQRSVAVSLTQAYPRGNY
jgi:hypothetical protein